MSIGEVTAIIASLASVIAACTSIFNRRAIHEVHLSMNSRLDQLLKSEIQRAHGEGMRQEREDEARRTNGEPK